MSGRPSSFITQEWCVHAQLTISHRPADASPTPMPRPADDGVRLEYSWNPVPPAKPSPSYGFQRGNITFTTRPPTHPPPPLDSGYNSLPGRGKPQQPYNRRCKSTCSITLSDVHDDSVFVGRSDSLRAPPQCSGGVPRKVSPVQEICEVCGGDRSPLALRRAANYTTHFCTRVADRSKPKEEGGQGQEGQEEVEVKHSQDVASQTQECQVESVKKPLQPRMGYKAMYNSRRKTDSDLLQVPVLDVPEAGNDKAKPGKRLSRSPARLSGKSPLLGRPARRQPSREKKSSSPSLDSVSTSHRPRTVHIDVYCTGSDASGSSSDSSDSSATPQTVFESNKVRVVHTRVGRDRLPQALQREPSLTSNLPRSITDRVRSESFKQQSSREEKVSRAYDSDDGLSSQYPSQVSSFSSIPQSSGVTSRDPSSSTLSSTSFALTEGYDSAAATSCKDTMTDVDTLSLIHSTLSLAPSDSFEYADSMDRVRIKEREQAWASRGEEGSKTWRSPQSERKQMLQQQKLKDFLAKHVGTSAFPLWKTEKADDSEEDDDDDTGDAWTFGQGTTKECALKREDTVRKAMPPEAALKIDSKKDKTVQDFGSLSDSSHQRVAHHFQSRSPSPCPAKVLSCIASPFTSRVGVRTDQLSRAEKFGTIVGVFRKPGHHVGPSKNPECSCAHCRSHCEQSEYRSRTRSLDISLEAADNWKTQLQEQLAKRAQNGSRKVQEVQADSDSEWDDSNAV